MWIIWSFSKSLACVAEVSFAFSREGDRASEQANGRAWGEQTMGRTGEGVMTCYTVPSF